MSEDPRVFHISPEWCGQERLTQIFRLNGYHALHHLDGALAQDILVSRAEGRAPLAAWRRARLFSGLHAGRSPWQAPLEAWRAFDWLDQAFPSALFILTTRDMDAWLTDRLTRDQGELTRRYARYLDVSEAEIPDLWEADMIAHISAVSAYFGDSPRLIRADMDSASPQDLCETLAHHIPFPRHPTGDDWLPPAEANAERVLMSLLDGQPANPPASGDVADDLARFCLQGLAPDGQGRPGVSRYYCEWDGSGRISGRDDGPLPLAIAPQPGRDRRVALARSPDVPFKFLRDAGVVNDVIALGRSDPIRCDMEDSRWMGTPDGEPLGVPVICHNRREGAQNVVLWPLPGVHGIGLPGFDGTAGADGIRFEDKLDRVVWRGMISGNLVTGENRPGLPSFHYLAALDRAGPDPAARAEAWEKLARTSRLSFVLKWFDNPDFDLGVVMAWRFREYAKDPLLAPFCKPRVGQNYLRRFRYQLYMAGYDHGSNFISAIDSQSVLLKEEDGWEVFYSGRFKPWKHYIPLQRYCLDVAEKLDWARKNPNECKEMSARARAEVALLRDPAVRRDMLARILDGIAQSG